MQKDIKKWKENVLEIIFNKKETNNVVRVLSESLNKLIFVINTEGKVVYINTKAQKYFKLLNYNNNIESFFDIGKDYIHSYLEGKAFSSIKIILKSDAFYIDIAPITLNSEIVGGLIVIYEKNDSVSFETTFQLLNNINKEIELFYAMYYDEIMVTDDKGKIIGVNNPVCEECYNLNEINLINTNVKELEDKGIFKPSITLKVIKEKKHISILQKTQTGKVLMVYGLPVFDSSFKLSKVFSTSKDLTEIYTLKEKLSKTEKLMEKYYLKLKEIKNEQNLFENVIYKSSQMRNLIDLIKRISMVDSHIILNGESGVGKTLFAKIIHKLSNRRNNEFVSINCGAIPENLLESELFGYEKGAFTGAKNEGKTGYIELANNGTLFLDEISELALQMQVKLLKVLDEKSFTRVGGIKPIKSDFRLIAATNKDLEKLTKENKFREDLFYRLNVIQISIPLLRERKDDIPLLVNFFIEKYNKKYNTNKKLDPKVFDVFLEYKWPGNVRELENIIERLVVTIDKNLIEKSDLPSFFFNQDYQTVQIDQILPLKKSIDNLEKQLLGKAYEIHKNTYKVAEVLRISQSSVVRKLKKYRININSNSNL
ncbi:Acetoacetate metabolism regulatory protein AtoC [Desulfurella amilsii]|uniref:HTH-type transcriptional regulatory protein TyrR n=1 Tax=Desulfurella amilsii TaxID=1562698 RepID=A0A1X4XYG7_9BACT|nr:sigma 54-interacting transcriptional regulator [Desulfurella amilsii]OSS42579.1 Acetoacetate metabolism regulatory protein AtoC [Desulfurella amilsii]